MNSRGGQKEKVFDKISLIYFNQIEAFHVSERGMGAEEFTTFALAGKIFEMRFYVLSPFLHIYFECP